MNEELFSEDDLKHINREAKKSIYSRIDLFHMGSNKLSIRGVSQSNGLILVYGNEWTGFKHIQERHCITSRKPYWQNNRIDNPTKFSLNTAPINYLSIASKIFKPENKNFDDNKKPDLFDLYIGSYKDRFGCEIEYKLIVYKNSKIIHTLFLNDNKKPFNKKKILNLRQGWTSSIHDPKNGIQTYNFSYFNEENIPLFKVIMRYFEVDNREKWYIQVNFTDGTAHYTTFVDKDSRIKREVSVPTRITQLDFEDISWLEKIIKKITNEKKQ